MTTATDEKTCTRCQVNPRVPKQQWCRECRAAWKRDDRAKKATPRPPALKETEPTGERPQYTPYRDATPAQEWYVPYLTHLAHQGGHELAAQQAGVSEAVATAALADDETFALEHAAAHRFYKALLEWELVDLARRKNNPLGYFGRLKAESPERYVEKSVIASLNMTIDTQATAQEAHAFLARFLPRATPSTLAALAALPSHASPDQALTSSTPEAQP